MTEAHHGHPSSQTSSRTSLPTPRQIRFISTDGQPHSKRRRINTACLTCRKRKTRCSGERPECKTCTENGHDCSGYADRTTRDTSGTAEDQDEEDIDSGIPTTQTHTKNVEPNAHQGQPPRQQEHDVKETLDAITSPASNHTASSLTSARNRVPYFRYFGPTAIVPGFKQMVVQVKTGRTSMPRVSGDSPSTGLLSNGGAALALDAAPVEIPFYDATDPEPVAPLITHLCQTFFTHLGCNYPFLQRERFLEDLKEKKVDAILVDAVCAVAARFSSSPLLRESNDGSIPLDNEGNVTRAFRGHSFAQRAMSAVIDTFSCPTIAVAQACLLLAYEEFGTDHDSGLWMYLGTAIRMAQDLGISKLEGLQLEGRIGPTPKTVKHGQEGKLEEQRRLEQQKALSQNSNELDDSKLADRRASEQERIDTFWAIFFLDRAVSSGVGRPVTLRDKAIEISFPYRADETTIAGCPDPFPAMLQTVHMYGRVADVLNNIKDISQVNPDVLKRLAGMERDLTGFYQRLSPKLHFNATNFQRYVKAGHGTNFILLHFWFHTLIVLVHQPTLLHSFEGRIQQLFPGSRELSMSSAKTIADILAFAELIDVKSFIGNPFTSQPMYVAACAFLAEAAAHTSQSSSRATSPRPSNGHTPHAKQGMGPDKGHGFSSSRYTLLATAANQNYQRCYKALKTLNSYWAGCRYILTALDQKSKGLMDPLLFTAEDVDGQMPSTEPSFTTPGWRRTTSIAASLGADDRLRGLGQYGARTTSASPMNFNQAIGWSLTGTADSSAPNVSFLYSTMNDGGVDASLGIDPQNEQTGFGGNRLPTQQHGEQPPIQQSLLSSDKVGQPYQTATAGTTDKSMSYDAVSTADADLLLGLHSPFSSSGPAPSSGIPSVSMQQSQIPDAFQYPPQPIPEFHDTNTNHQQFLGDGNNDFNNMMIESQEMDMGAAQQLNFGFPGNDVIPWLEYLPQDVLTYFGDRQEDEEDAVLPNTLHPG